MRKVWRCPVEFDVYVLAENETEAMEIAENNAAEELKCRFGNVTGAYVITEAKYVDAAILHSLPYAESCDEDDGLYDLTIKQIFEIAAQRKENARKVAELDARQGKLFKEGGNG